MQHYNQTQWPNWGYSGSNDSYSGYGQQVSNYSSYFADSMEVAYHNHQQHLAHHQQMSRTTESKPRLSKEEVEILEAEFQKNHKPNSTTKKALAESMRVENARINNWFQNRRAREKKENNVRQYEARQKVERDRLRVDSGSDEESDERSDLVASSAPFPGRREASASRADTPATSLDQSVTDKDSEAGDTTHDYLGITDVSGVPRRGDLNCSLSDSETLLRMDEQSPEYYFGSYTGGFGANAEYSSNLRSEDSFHDAPVLQHGSQFRRPNDEELLKSPSATDIASRRNRRPPHLSITGSRSYSNGIPMTASDLGRKGDVGSSMRRVASATGAVRISKPTSIPQSPYGVKTDALFHLNRSPRMMAARGTIAPPTPDTPIVARQQDASNGVQKYATGELAVPDPTLRTPPTTPGLVDGLSNIQSRYGMAFPSNSFVSHDVSNFAGDFDYTNIGVSVPEYLSSGNESSSQSEGAFYPPRASANYFAAMGNSNAEYNNYSDASHSEHSSPGHLASNLHYSQ